MIRLRNLTVVGTSHVSPDSIKEVERVLLDVSPDITALELDLPRFKALLSPKEDRKLTFKDVRRLGFKGFLFNLLGAWAEKKIGDVVGVSPGSEMLKAVSVSKKINSDIALVDQDISITLKRLSSSITWKERFRFVYDLFHGVFVRKPIPFDLRKVPSKEVVDLLVSKVKKDYPSFYRVLIHERNIFMSKNLYNLMNSGKKVVAIVGAGHEQDLIDLIDSYDKPQKAKFVLLKHQDD